MYARAPGRASCTKYVLRVPLTKFRVSAHALRIETGRYNRPHKLALEERLCWFCKNTVEDEMHFLLECPLYSENRQVLLRECVTLNKSFVYFSTADKFLFLLGTKSEMLQYALARFIKISFKTRLAEFGRCYYLVILWWYVFVVFVDIYTFGPLAVTCQ